MEFEGIKEHFKGEFQQLCAQCASVFEPCEIATLMRADAEPLDYDDFFIKPCGVKGEGLFASIDIEKGTILDIAPAIIIPFEQYDNVAYTIVGNYLFGWNDDYTMVLCTSLCEFANHSYNPNAVYVKDFGGQSIIFRALRDIKKGEEITINYNGKIDDKSPTWFDIKD